MFSTQLVRVHMLDFVLQDGANVSFLVFEGSET